jgi:hypothetical protein
MRHGRIDAWRALGAMMLLRGQGAAYSARTIVRPALHLHTHFAGSALFTVSMRPAVTRTMILRSLAPFASARRHEPAAAAHAQLVLAPAPVHRAAVAGLPAPAFVPARRFAAPSRAAAARGEPIRLAVRRGEAASPIAAQAGAIALRLRRSASREEVRPAPPAAVLAVARRAAAQDAGHALDTVDERPVSRLHMQEARAQQPAAAVNVEALTGMVIQQIDRRLVAFRERMGRT